MIGNELELIPAHTFHWLAIQEMRQTRVLSTHAGCLGLSEGRSLTTMQKSIVFSLLVKQSFGKSIRPTRGDSPARGVTDICKEKFGEILVFQPAFM